ncbi:alpha/beta fold hydrolase [Kitasatospora sp. NPDC086009]|uniref:alpha/beta fold hydrolase n=1 Tax=unclassified Kitasatospora TaxID=2633591 RepID=UPI0037C5D579
MGRGSAVGREAVQEVELHADAVDVGREELGCRAGAPTITPGTHTTCTELKRVQAGVLDIGYAEAGPKHEPVVICLHGRPYDIHGFLDVAPLLADAGYRVIVPYLRGHGTTHFLSPTTVRTGQQSAIALDVLALMGALKIHNAVPAGFDLGSRAAGTISTLWPERVKALVAASGYLIVNIPSQQNPLPTKTEHTWWYQYYFATDRGRVAMETKQYRHDLCRLVWKEGTAPGDRPSQRPAERRVPSAPGNVGIPVHRSRVAVRIPGEDIDGGRYVGPSMPVVPVDPVRAVPRVAVVPDALADSPALGDDRTTRRNVGPPVGVLGLSVGSVVEANPMPDVDRNIVVG